MPQEKAVKAERMRDLRGQVEGISDSDPEVQFQIISPGREPVTVYSTADGSPIEVPAYMLGAVMATRDEKGGFRFVADAKDAPEYRQGTVKCFLHPDSPERPILEMVGLGGATCPAEHLGSAYSKRMHSLHRHKQEFAAWQEFVENKKEERREARQDEQLAATLSIARGNQQEPAFRDVVEVPRVVPPGECDICGRTGLKRVKAHKSMAHKEV